MATISFDEFLKQAGGTTKNIQVESANQPSQSQQKGDSYFSRIKQDFINRRQNVANINTNNPAEKILQNAGQVAGGVTDLVTELPGVRQGLGAIGSGITAVSKVPGIKQAGEIISPVTQKAIDTYNSLPENLRKDIEAGLNIASIIPVGGAGELGAKTALKTGELAVEGIKPVTNVAGKTLKSIGESAYGLSVPMEEGTKIALQTYEAKQPTLLGRVKNVLTGESVGTKPITEQNTAVRNGLVGTEWQLGVQAKRIANNLWETNIAPKLDAVKENVNMKSFFDDVEKRIKTETKELSRRNALLEGLDSLKSDFKNVNNVSLSKLQEYKEGWAKNLPEATYKGKPIGSALKNVKNLAAEKARQTIYNLIGDEGKQAYLDYGNLQSIQKAGRKAVDQLRSKGFTKQTWEFILDKLVTPIATVGGRVLYRTGEGLEFIGNKGAKKVKDIIK